MAYSRWVVVTNKPETKRNRTSLDIYKHTHCFCGVSVVKIKWLTIVKAGMLCECFGKKFILTLIPRCISLVVRIFAQV